MRYHDDDDATDGGWVSERAYDDAVQELREAFAVECPISMELLLDELRSDETGVAWSDNAATIRRIARDCAEGTGFSDEHAADILVDYLEQRIEGERFYAKAVVPPSTTYCQCVDPECPACQGECTGVAADVMYRIDMVDETGTSMCDDCADDAVHSGLFGTEPYSMPQEDETCADCQRSYGPHRLTHYCKGH